VRVKVRLEEATDASFLATRLKDYQRPPLMGQKITWFDPEYGLEGDAVVHMRNYQTNLIYLRRVGVERELARAS